MRWRKLTPSLTTPCRIPPTECDNVAITDPSFTLLDVWGQPYRLSMDTDGDGKVSDPEHPGMWLAHPVIVWSAGDDGNPATWADNIKSW